MKILTRLKHVLNEITKPVDTGNKYKVVINADLERVLNEIEKLDYVVITDIKPINSNLTLISYRKLSFDEV